MKEILKLRVNSKYANLLFSPNEGRKLGKSIQVIEIAKEDPRYEKVPIIEAEIKKRYGDAFFFGWEILRNYNKHEFDNADLLNMNITNTFEPTGEECGTVYDYSDVCSVCGVGRIQKSMLKLKQDSIPKKDISRTIAGELVVSEKFASACSRYNLKGILFNPIIFCSLPTDSFFQLSADISLKLSTKTVAGINPFDLSINNGDEIYKCPFGHTIGLNIISEAHIHYNSSISNIDFFASDVYIGVERGLLYPQQLHLCSPALKSMVEKEKLTGFNFEVAHVE